MVCWGVLGVWCTGVVVWCVCKVLYYRRKSSSGASWPKLKQVTKSQRVRKTEKKKKKTFSFLSRFTFDCRRALLLLLFFLRTLRGLV